MSAIESPCRQICVIDRVSDLCIGCGRTRDEIGGWIGYTPAERRAVMATLDERLARLTAERPRLGGRRARLAAREG